MNLNPNIKGIIGWCIALFVTCLLLIVMVSIELDNIEKCEKQGLVYVNPKYSQPYCAEGKKL